MNVYALILAGGTGSRLWPLSRNCKPKQLLKLNPKSNNTMIYDTVNRIKKFIPSSNIIVLTSQDLQNKILYELDGILPQKNIIKEKKKKGTAAAIIYGTKKILEKDSTAIVSVFPSDSYIDNVQEYLKTIRYSIKAVRETGKISIIGIISHKLSKGLGYFTCKEEKEGKKEYLYVKKFLEKPKDENMKFIEHEKIYTNTGIVIGYGEKIIKEYYKCMKYLKQSNKSLVNSSFDKIVLENSKDIIAIEGNFIWDDMGTLDKIRVHLSEDEYESSTTKKFICFEGNNVTCIPNDKMIITFGISDSIIVDTEDLIFVTDYKRIQDIPDIVDYLKEKGMEQYV